MAAKRIISLFRSCSSFRIHGFASVTGYSRTTEGLPDPPIHDISWARFLEDHYGTDYKHWFVSVDGKPKGTREEMVAHYVKIMTDFVGNEEEARKKMYMVSTRYYYAFGALISEKEAKKLKQVPHVHKVLPDSYVNRETKDYGGEPIINGQLVPYDPKYHKFYTDFWTESKARALAEERADAEARARGELEIDEEDDNDDDDDDDDNDGTSEYYYAKRLKKIEEYYDDKLRP